MICLTAGIEEGCMVLNSALNSAGNSSKSCSVPLGKLASGSYYVSAIIEGVRLTREFKVY